MKRWIACAAGSAALLLLLTVAAGRAQSSGGAMTAAFSDPDRPGSISLATTMAAIIVRGGIRRDVAIGVRGEDSGPPQLPSPPGGARPSVPPAPPGGLRRIDLVPGISVTEDNNRMVIAILGGGTIEMQTPRRVNLKLSTINGGDIVIDDIDGEIDAANVNGSIRLTNVAGSVVANSQNGDVRVVLNRIASDKPMAFASFNGDIDVTLPAATKANLRLRTEHGDVFTDFDLQMRPNAAPRRSRPGGGTMFEMGRQLVGAINGGGPEFELRTFNGDIRLRKGAR